MIELLNIAREHSPRLMDQIRDRLSRDHWPRGLLVGVDPSWMEAWVAGLLLLPPRQDSTLDTRWWLRHANPDYSFRPPNWKRHCDTLGLQEEVSPVYLTVVLRREKGAVDLGELPQMIGEHRVVYEYRGPCKGHFVRRLRTWWDFRRRRVPIEGGTSLGGRSLTGTLGGFLHDPVTRDRFAVTCGHVLGSVGEDVYHPARVGGIHIGRVEAVALPPGSDPKQGCDHHGQSPDDCRTDVAAARIASGTECSPLIRRLGSVTEVGEPGQVKAYEPVSFVGKQSGLVEATVRHGVSWYEFDMGEGEEKETRCLCDGFQIGPSRRQYVLEPVSQEGDSGAWIFSKGRNGWAWDGILIGGDENRSVCGFSEYALDALRAKTQLKLGLIY